MDFCIQNIPILGFPSVLSLPSKKVYYLEDAFILRTFMTFDQEILAHSTLGEFSLFIVFIPRLKYSQGPEAIYGLVVCRKERRIYGSGNLSFDWAKKNLGVAVKTIEEVSDFSFDVLPLYVNDEDVLRRALVLERLKG